MLRLSCRGALRSRVLARPFPIRCLAKKAGKSDKSEGVATPQFGQEHGGEAVRCHRTRLPE